MVWEVALAVHPQCVTVRTHTCIITSCSGDQCCIVATVWAIFKLISMLGSVIVVHQLKPWASSPLIYVNCGVRF